MRTSLNLSLLLCTLVLTVPSLTGVEATTDADIALEPEPLIAVEEPPVPAQVIAFGDRTVTFTTEPARLGPREGTLIARVYRDGQPVVGERYTLRLEGRKRTLLETPVVTDEKGTITLTTYFDSAGTYTLTLTDETGNVSFPVTVRGTRLLVFGLIIACGILVTLVFERRII